MNENSPKTGPTAMKRRSFFSSAVVAIIGGYLGGGLLRGLFARKRDSHHQRKSMKISIHPQAVPRAKESSHSHV